MAPKTKNLPRSPMWRMADALTKGRLEDRLRELRGEGRSYDEISRVLFAEAQVNASGRTIREWCVQIGTDDAPESEPDDDGPTAATG